MKAKKGSSRYKGFVEKHGKNIWELEAVPPAVLQDLLRRAIEQVLDVAAYNREVRAEKRDKSELAEMRRQAIALLKPHIDGAQ
jgi:hypothetical protein